MKKALFLVGWAALLAVCLSIAPGPANAQQRDEPLTKQRVKARAQKAAQMAKMTWESLSPQQQQQIIQQAQVTAEAAKERWNAMTPQQRQQVLQHAKAGGQRLAKWWKQLPPGTSQ